MPQVDPDVETFALIKVVGVGGAGGSAVNRMVDSGITGVDFFYLRHGAKEVFINPAVRKKRHLRGFGQPVYKFFWLVYFQNFSLVQNGHALAKEFGLFHVMGG